MRSDFKLPALKTYSPTTIRLHEHLRRIALNGCVSGVRQRELADAIHCHEVQVSNSLQFLESRGHIQILRERTGVRYLLVDPAL